VSAVFGQECYQFITLRKTGSNYYDLIYGDVFWGEKRMSLEKKYQYSIENIINKAAGIPVNAESHKH
jgi:hypothetical protein